MAVLPHGAAAGALPAARAGARLPGCRCLLCLRTAPVTTYPPVTAAIKITAKRAPRGGGI